MIIRLIKAARRANEDLHWSAVTRRRDDLGRPRLGGADDAEIGEQRGDAAGFEKVDQAKHHRVHVAGRARAQQGRHRIDNDGDRIEIGHVAIHCREMGLQAEQARPPRAEQE